MADYQRREIVIGSSTTELEVVRTFVGDAAEHFGFREKETYQIILAVDEACSNVIRHGYNKEDAHEIRIAVEGKDKRFTITVSDTGESYDIRAHNLPNMNQYLAEHRSGGLGIKLIRTLVDDIQYEQTDTVNRLVLTKNLTT
jgi:serine/threonine-protein kinase RsbW